MLRDSLSEHICLSVSVSVSVPFSVSVTVPASPFLSLSLCLVCRIVSMKVFAACIVPCLAVCTKFLLMSSSILNKICCNDGMARLGSLSEVSEVDAWNSYFQVAGSGFSGFDEFSKKKAMEVTDEIESLINTINVFIRDEAALDLMSGGGGRKGKRLGGG